MLNGNIVCGIEVGRFTFRVGKELEAEVLARPGAAPMDTTGKPMRGIIWVDADDVVMAEPYDMQLGRKTYELFAPHRQQQASDHDRSHVICIRKR